MDSAREKDSNYAEISLEEIIHKNGNDNQPHPSRRHQDEENEIPEIQVYKIRYLMLVIVFVVNLAFGALWLSFSTVPEETANFFNVNGSQVDWFSTIFFSTTVPMMLVALFVTDQFGFRLPIQIGCACLAIGSIIRLVSTTPNVPEATRYPLAIAGQVIASQGQPFALAVQTKLSQEWFPEHQRTLSTGLAVMGGAVGFVVASVLFPVMIDTYEDIPNANYVICSLCIAIAFCAFAVRHPRPPKPPSRTAAEQALRSDKHDVRAYFAHIYLALKNKDFMVLVLVIGGGMGLIRTLQSMMTDILCPSGYDEGVVGICKACMLLGGFVGGAFYMETTKRLHHIEEFIKVGFTFAVVAAMIFTMLLRVDYDITWALALTNGLFGFLAMGVYPLCLETGADTSYPVDATFTSGLIVMSGQIQGAIFPPIMNALSRPLGAIDMEKEVCHLAYDTQPYDIAYSGIYMIVYASVLNCIFLFFFKPKFRRQALDTPTVKSRPQQGAISHN